MKSCILQSPDGLLLHLPTTAGAESDGGGEHSPRAADEQTPQGGHSVEGDANGGLTARDAGDARRGGEGSLPRSATSSRKSSSAIRSVQKAYFKSFLGEKHFEAIFAILFTMQAVV